MKTSTLPLLLALIGLSSARTDISGCVSSATTNQWHEASMIWYVPGSGEICDFIDCGGGLAPPKTDQPGCPLYTGTETVTPSYLPGYGPNGSKMAATTNTVSETTSSSSAHATTHSSSPSTATNTSGGMITAAPTTSPVVSMTTTTSSASRSDNSTSSTTTSIQTGGAATNVSVSSNMAGFMAVIAAVIGVVSL